MPHVTEAFQWFQSNWRIFDSLEAKSMLYVGWTRPTKAWWKDEFCDKLGITSRSIIDIFPANAQAARQTFSDIGVIEGDIAKLGDYVQKGEYDVIFWDHGPEHADEDKLPEILNLMKEYAAKLVVCACPWGSFPQSAIYGNVWEEHRFNVMPEHFGDMQVVKINTVHQSDPCGELIAYWINND